MAVNLAAIPSEGLPRFPALDNTLGAVLIGTGISSILAGVSLHQVFRYFRRYPKDNLSCKATVSILCLLDTLHEVLIIHVCYFYLISNYFKPWSLISGVWSLRLVVPATGAISTVSHVFFARRVLILSGSKRMTLPVALITTLLVLSEIVFCSVTTVYLFLDKTFTRFVDHSSWLISTSLGTRVVCDIVITGAMIYQLRISRTGFRKTDSILDLLILFAINTGLLTSVVNLASVITAVLWPDALVYCGIYIVSSKLYSISVLTVLNSRRSRNKHSAENNKEQDTTWMEMSDRISAACRTGTNLEFNHDSVLDVPSKGTTEMSRSDVSETY
ncbi:hypothetical protein OH76DRAFT_108400 [Lentinus brumalis]|uniref:DUF6534 domain-containing protein n=1 Tax=Lentinus brumalis TaxID=2498619 RepID=A0A371CPY3_9APHY|nr:hypothetical protein OH76DRAFT_108400 [Polyporus brumalis]